MKKTTNDGVTVQTTQDGHIEVSQPSLLGKGEEASVTLVPDTAQQISEWLREAVTEARHLYKSE